MTRLLIIYHRIPFPIRNGGDKVRVALLKTLSRIVDITFICHDPDPGSRNGDIAEMEKFCKKVIVVRIPKVKRTLFTKPLQLWRLILYNDPLAAQSRYIREFGNALVDEVRSGRYQVIQTFSHSSAIYNSLIREIDKDVMIISGPGDDLFTKLKTKRSHQRSIHQRIINYLELRSIVIHQNKYIENSDHALFFSQDDVVSVRTKIKPENRHKVTWLPGIIETEDSWDESSPERVEPGSICFVGGMIPWFNRQAVIHFANNILPLIHEQVGEAKFYVIGYNPDNKFTLESLAYRKGVEIVGSVKSISEHLERMAVFVSPVLSGAGVKTKVIEALRYGKPVVATAKGAQGLWDKSAIIIRDNDKAFSDEVIRLLQDNNYRLNKNYESRNLFLEKYSYSVVSRDVVKIFTGIIYAQSGSGYSDHVRINGDNNTVVQH